MLYLTAAMYEHCRADKRRERTVCPGVWIHYVIRGRGEVCGRTVTAGEGFFADRGTYLAYEPDREDPWSYVWINLGGEDTEGLLYRCGFGQGLSLFRFSYAEELVALVTAITKGARTPDARPLFREAAAKLILSLHAPHNTPSRSIGEQTVARACRRIEEAYRTPMTVEGLAEELRVDRRYLRNLFVRYRGVSTKEYLTRYRLSRACELLRHAPLSVGEIAAEVGYPDALTFSRLFKKHIGVSPAKYRKTQINVCI